jgi:hypothetical protein
MARLSLTVAWCGMIETAGDDPHVFRFCETGCWAVLHVLNKGKRMHHLVSLLPRAMVFQFVITIFELHAEINKQVEICLYSRAKYRSNDP